jgi:hypothetical protein
MIKFNPHNYLPLQEEMGGKMQGRFAVENTSKTLTAPFRVDL